MNSIARLLWGKSSTVVVRGDSISFEIDGIRRSFPLCDYLGCQLEETFLGLFGCDLILACVGGRHITVPGLKKKDALSIRRTLEVASRDLAIREARIFLADNGEAIAAAWSSLQKDRYLSKRELMGWQTMHSSLRGLAFLPESEIRSDAAISCRQIFLDPDTWRKIRNDTWVSKEIVEQEGLLNGIAGKKLTQSQKEAILRHDNAVLVVAGAGTGKTTTVITKVAYLLSKGICKAEDILLLSFSRAAAEELRKRVAASTDANVEARTFHSLGLEIVTEATGVKPAISGNAIDTERILNRILRDIMSEGGELARKLVRHLAYDFYPEKKEHEFSDKKSQLAWATRNDYTTLNGEKVKSNQEVQIANWLLLNGINYEYETAYKEARTGTREKRVYKPDFYLPDYNIYIEHWGIGRDGGTKRGVDRQKYMLEMGWKQNLHREYGTTLVETFSSQGFEGDLEKSLEKQLRSHGVEINPLTYDELIKLKSLRERFGVIAAFLSRCMALYKGNHEGAKLLEKRFHDPKVGDREKRFLPIFESVLARYEAGLQNRGEVDFGDMITKAASFVRSGKYKSRFSVIIIDEFQDISRGRAFLIQSLIDQMEDPRLLCVGDDWQSIYRFNGSDVTLMTQFEKHWEDPVKINLRETQRFGQELQEVTTKFITSNPGQIQRELEGKGRLGGPAVHITQDDADTIIQRLQSTVSNQPDVLVLGRYKHSTKSIHTDWKSMTAHGSKGLEADYVIVQDLGVGRYGFPSEIEDDPIISLFLSESEDFPNAEERRLFYVALTRAKKEVWLIPGNSGISPFIEELIENPKYSGLVTRDEESAQSQVKCPDCSGRMIVRSKKSDGAKFLGCIYFPRCNGTLPGCPQCRKSIPQKKEGRLFCNNCDWSGPVFRRAK